MKRYHKVLIVSTVMLLLVGLAYAGAKQGLLKAPPHQKAELGDFHVVKDGLPGGKMISGAAHIQKTRILHSITLPHDRPISKQVEPYVSALRQWESEQTKQWRQYLIDEGWVNPDGSQKYIPGEVIIQFENEERGRIIPDVREGVPVFGIASVDAINETYGAQSLDRVVRPEEIKPGTEALVEKHGLDLIYLIRFPQDVDVKQISDEYLKDPAIDEASPNWQLYPMDIPQHAAPNDPYYAQTPWSWTDMKCLEAWNVSTGSQSVRICHIALGGTNTGAHPDNTNTDLDLNYLGSHGGQAGSATTHATACTGCMAAENNNGYGQPGVAGGWGTTHGCTWTYYGMRSQVQYEILAFKWGADNSCIVENASFGGGSPGAGVEDAVNYAFDNGCLVTASSGNADYSEISYPAYFGNAIAVGATQAGDENIFTYGPWVECIATGGQYSIGYNGMAWGTSFSAPKAAGVIGLIKSNHSGWSVSQIRAALVQASDWVDYIPLNSGRSGLMGGGRVNPYEAMRLYNHNVSVNTIYRPQCDDGDSVDAYSSITPQVVVQNRGIFRETFTVICRIDTMGGTNVYADTQFVEGLADRTDKVNKGKLVSFDSWSVGGPSALYQITTYTTLAGDMNYLNDTIRDTICVKSSGAAGVVYLRRNDADTPTGVGTGYANNDYSVYLPAPSAPCSIIGARVWVENPSARVCTLWVGPDSTTHPNRYAPGKPWPQPMGSRWVEKVFTPNNNAWTEINFSNSEKYWMASPQGFHVTIYTPTADVSLCGDNPAEYQDANGYYARNNDPHLGWGWTYIYSSGQFVFFLQAKIKYITNNNDVAVSDVIRPKTHELNRIPLIPQAVVANVGEYAQSGFDVTMEIDSVGIPIYSDTKQITGTLGKFQSDTVSFAGWAPDSDYTYNVQCYTELAGDQNRHNDTLYRNVTVNDYDTLFYDDNSPYWIFTDDNCFWAVTFYPSRPCSVIGADYMLYVGGTAHACTLCAYEAENDTPTTRRWSQPRIPADGWNTYTFNASQKFARPNAEDFSLTLYTYGLLGGDTVCPIFDNTDESPYHTYANTGTGWDSPLIYDMMLRARIRYYGNPYDHDVGVVSLDEPLPYDWKYPYSPVTPQITIKNYGLSSEAFNVVYQIIDSLGAIEWADTLNTTLGIAETKQVSFDDWAPQVADMDYTMRAYTVLGSDQNNSNDTLDDPVYCRTINVISYNEETWGDLGLADQYYAVRFTPERPCTVWGALINIWPNRDNCTAPCTVFLWNDTLDRPASGTYIEHIPFTPNGVGASQGGYIYQVRLDFTGTDGSNYETDHDFWIGAFARISGADTVLVPFSDFADYENIAGRSLSNSNRTNVGEWYSPRWISGADTSQADWEIKALVKYLSYPGDAPIPPYIMVNKQGSDAVLAWDSVKVDVSGNPIICDHYTTYYSTLPDYVPDYTHLLAAGPDTTATHSLALSRPSNYYYLVYAFNEYGTKSAKSNMGYAFQKFVNENSGATSDRNWVSLPWHCEYSTVSDLTDDLSPAGDPLIKVTTLQDDQIYRSWIWDPDFLEWYGTDFAIVSGKSYEMVTASDDTIILVGSNNPNGLVPLNENPGATSDRNWVSIPYNAVYGCASDITDEYSPMGDPLIKLTTLQDDQVYRSWIWDPDFEEWYGTDFTVEAGRGYEFVTISDATWNPTEYSNLTERAMLARRKARKTNTEVNAGTLTEPQRMPVWTLTDVGYVPATNKSVAMVRDAGISHVARAHFDIDEYEEITFTAYRSGLPYDVLNEEVFGCGIARNDSRGAIWFDVGNFYTPWQHGEEVILIVEALRYGRGYFAVVTVSLDKGTDIQELSDLELAPIPELLTFAGGMNALDNENIIGYSVYEGDRRLNNQILTDYYTANDEAVIRLVFKGGCETVYASHGAPAGLIPRAYAFSIYPNPFTHKTTVNFAIPQSTPVEVKVYDVSGKLVKTLVSETQKPGYYNIFWHGDDNIGRHVASGVYFVQMNAEGFESQQKVVFVH